MAKEKTYTEAIEKLEELLEMLKGDEISIDNMCASVKEATELIQFCKEKIFKTEQEINKCLNELNNKTNDDDDNE